MSSTLPASMAASAPSQVAPVSKPRLGFLGVGWIGRNRLEAIAASGVAEIVAIADSLNSNAAQAAQVCPGAQTGASLPEVLQTGVDGVVIATPSALHAEQTVAALEAGAAVFCQKPLGRSAKETHHVISLARQNNHLLGVDLSYRFVTEVRAVYDLVRSGELGDIYAVELVFHNAYGPDKEWYYDWHRSGGGCVMDLGIHLVDLALWTLGPVPVANVTSRLFSRGQPIRRRGETVEDYALARLDLASGATVQLACSWNLPAGCEAVISGKFYGTRGGAGFHNLNGSFYHFQAERFRGTQRDVLAATTEPWGGRAAVDWARRLAGANKFDPEIETLNQVAATLDAVYGIKK